MRAIHAVNFNALDLNLVRVFDALMRERSVTRAGERIGLSQPAVSAALNRLRHVFNDPLFVRQGNEMVPTPRAQDLAERARVALFEIEEMVRSVRGLDLATLDRTFTLLGADFFAMHLMPHLARRVATVAPGVRLRFLDSARGDVARLLLDNAIDMALERPLEMPEWISSTLLFHSPFVMIASAANAALADLAEGDVLPLDRFTRLPHAIRSIDGTLSGMVDAALAEHGVARSVRLALPQFQSVAYAVAASDHIAAVPEQFARRVRGEIGLKTFALPVPVPVPTINLYWHSRNDRDGTHQWMRGMVRDAVVELGF